MKISKPSKPREPDPDECCGTGCVRCVWDIYNEAMERYTGEMKTWEALVGIQGTLNRTVGLWRPRGIPSGIFRSVKKHTIVE